MTELPKMRPEDVPADLVQKFREAGIVAFAMDDGGDLLIRHGLAGVLPARDAAWLRETGGAVNTNEQAEAEFLRLGELYVHACERIEIAEERIRLARRALTAEGGYFTADQVTDDIAPRITEIIAATRAHEADTIRILEAKNDALEQAEAERDALWMQVDRFKRAAADTTGETR